MPSVENALKHQSSVPSPLQARAFPSVKSKMKSELEGKSMVKTLVAALLVAGASMVWAQDKAPAGSADRGYQAYMKYQCYTCHGTVVRGVVRCTGLRHVRPPISSVRFVVLW